MNPWISLNRKFLIFRTINRKFIFTEKTPRSADFAAFFHVPGFGLIFLD